MVGLMATSSRMAYAIPTSAAPRVPVPAVDHHYPMPPQGTLKHSSVSVSVGSLGAVHIRFVWALWASLVGMEFDFKCEFAPPTILLWLLFALGCGVPTHSCFSAYHLTAVSLTLAMGYHFTAAPAKHSHCFWPWTWGFSSWVPLLTLDVGCLLSAAPGPRMYVRIGL